MPQNYRILCWKLLRLIHTWVLRLMVVGHIKGNTVGREGFPCYRPYNRARTWHSRRLSFRRPSDNRKTGFLYMATRDISLFLVCAFISAYFYYSWANYPEYRTILSGTFPRLNSKICQKGMTPRDLAVPYGACGWHTASPSTKGLR